MGKGGLSGAGAVGTGQGGHAMSTGPGDRVAQQRAEMPRRFRASYDRAMSGKSRKAAMYSFCTQCCGWEIKEVFLCTSPECPLFPYRPRSRVSRGASEGLPNHTESKKATQRVCDMEVQEQ